MAIKTKKAFSLILALVLCISCVACGGNEDSIRNALQGSWVAKWSLMGNQLSRYYTFKGDTYTTGGVSAFGEVEPETGTFEIEDSVIRLIPDDGSEGSDLDYSFNKESGTIILWWSDDVQFEKGTVNVNYQ